MCMTDCRDLYDCVTGVGKRPTEVRLLIDIQALREYVETIFRWVATEYMIADCLTKTGVDVYIRWVMENGIVHYMADTDFNKKIADQKHLMQERRRKLKQKRKVQAKPAEEHDAHDGANAVHETMMVESSGSEQRSGIGALLRAAAAGLALGAAIAGGSTGTESSPEPKAKAKAKPTAKSESVPTARRQICKCCGAVGRTAQGCSCQGGKSHQCLKTTQSSGASSSGYVPAGEPLVYFADTAADNEGSGDSDSSWQAIKMNQSTSDKEESTKKTDKKTAQPKVDEHEQKATKETTTPKTTQSKSSPKPKSKLGATGRGRAGCPECGGMMVMKSAHRGGCFWGCAAYPSCRGTRRPNDVTMG